jgi:glutathione peroxidase
MLGDRARLVALDRTDEVPFQHKRWPQRVYGLLLVERFLKVVLAERMLPCIGGFDHRVRRKGFRDRQQHDGCRIATGMRCRFDKQGPGAFYIFCNRHSPALSLMAVLRLKPRQADSIWPNGYRKECHMSELYDVALTRIDGTQTTLREYRDKVLLIVNTASHCGFTPQYADLESLFRAHKDQGLVVLGFPCNQFGKQEPQDDPQIASFCEKNYGVSFPMFAKVEVNGQNAHPLFVLLKKHAPGLLGSEAIKWNFTKFLINRDGKVLDRFAPATSVDRIAPVIATLL